MSPTKRFRSNLSDLFLAGGVSAERCHSLLVDGQLAGAANVSALAKPNQKKNCSRDLLKRLSRKSGSCWPPVYWADVRTQEPKTGKVVAVSLPFLLPHDIVHALARDATDIASLLSHENLGRDSRNHMSKTCQHLACDPSGVLPIGIWGDGAPFNWDRTQSLDTWTMSLPGLAGHGENLRFPLIAVPHQHVGKHITTDDISAVLSWSCQCLAAGISPSCRHDGAPWTKGDSKRKKHGGCTLGVRGLVVKIRKSASGCPSTMETVVFAGSAARRPPAGRMLGHRLPGAKNV